MEATRTMLAHSKLGKRLWGEAANNAVYILNRTGPSPVEGKTPYEVYHGKVFDIGFLKGGFGCEVWAYVPKEKRKKLDMKSRLGLLMGYSEETKGYRVYYKEIDEVHIEREIIVAPDKRKELTRDKVVSLDVGSDEEVEQEVTNSQYEDTDRRVVEEKMSDNYREDENLKNCIGSSSGVVSRREVSSVSTTKCMSDESSNEEEWVDSVTEVQEVESDWRPKRLIKQPKRLEDYETLYFSLLEEPATYEQAMAGPHSSSWQEAIDEELKAIQDNETWSIVEKPSNCEIIDSKWVFRIKRDKEGNISKFKCRLVAKGFKQEIYEDIYSPVVKLSTIRILLAISVNMGWSVYQLDVCNAF